MAVFQFNNRTIPYTLGLGPFHFDLVLLQGSEGKPDFWKVVLDDFKNRPYGGGRILTCEWYEAELAEADVARDFVKLMQTLALISVRVVAFDDAVEMLAPAQALQPRLFERTLFFPNGGPTGDDLKRVVHEFCQF